MTMHLPRFRVRTLMFVVWLFALLAAGAVDVLKEQRNRSRVEVIDEQTNADGSSTATLIYNHRTYYFVGPIPLGPCPIALLSGMAFAASIVGWIRVGRGQGKNQ
jgi:hypothetical protein